MTLSGWQSETFLTLSSGLNTVDLRDRDLISIQEARDLVAGAIDAQKTFAAFSQHRVDAVVEACASAAAGAAETLARAAVSSLFMGELYCLQAGIASTIFLLF